MFTALLFSQLVFTPTADASQPNVLVILTDDQGWGDLGINGNSNLKTPHIDSIAKNGAMFDRFFVQPVCSPTRAEFLTGRYHPRMGVHDTSLGGERLNLQEKTIADSFKAANYRTACIGKWHNGSQYPYHPRGRGFDHYYGFTSGHWGDYFDSPLELNGEPVNGKGYITDDFTDQAISWIGQNRDQPFFCWLTYNAPHSPMQVPDEYWKRFAEKPIQQKGSTGKEDVQFTKAAMAMCENVDDNVGRLLKYLKEQKRIENTIIVFMCDNGPNSNRWNGGMKGIKGSTDEGGVRSPLFIMWEKKIASNRKIVPIAAAIDLLPTLTELAGVKRVGELPLDGVSLINDLIPPKDGFILQERMIYNFWNDKLSVRSQQYRFDEAAGRLYDMQADPAQTKPIENAELKKQFEQAAAKWRKDVLPAGYTKKETRPITVGYSQFPKSILPARDGQPNGDIKRSAKAPNCSYFTNWKTTKDSMTWELEVNEAGRYEAEIWYTSPKAGLGSVVELTAGEAKWNAKLTQESDPPLEGKEHDRVPRNTESYVKKFTPLSLGQANLAKGICQLKLKASEIPGGIVCDIRQIILTKVK